ncbi:hypothetical protein [Streptomyces hydrogenans]
MVDSGWGYGDAGWGVASDPNWNRRRADIGWGVEPDWYANGDTGWGC